MAKNFHQFLSKKGLEVNTRTLRNSIYTLFPGCGSAVVLLVRVCVCTPARARVHVLILVTHLSIFHTVGFITISGLFKVSSFYEESV